MNEDKRKNTTDSYMWVYGTEKHSTHQIRIFEYQPGRSGKYPQRFLKDFKRFIHTDAYAGYNKLPDVTRCFCWAHLRRKFVDVLPKATVPSKGSSVIGFLK